MVEDVHKLVGC